MLKRILQQGLLVLLGFAVALIVVEVGARLHLWGFGADPFSAEAYRAAMEKQARGTEERSGGPVAGERSGKVLEMLHPYLGFVPDPSAFADQTTVGDPGQILAASADSLIVGVSGGSFAAGVCHLAGGELRRVLARPGKQVRLLCLASGGYKQPQQVLALTYLLAQGAHFDLIINLDGFNEVALPPENVRQHVAPIYPQTWQWRVGNVRDPNALKLLGELSILDRDRRNWADRFLRWRSERSALLSLVWERRDRVFAARRSDLLAALQDLKVEQRKSYAVTGPTMTFTDDQSRFAYYVRVWRDSSLQMKLLCDANHIAYVHFLQPNQHVVDSKPLAPEEVRLVKVRSAYQDAAVRGYPLLRQQGEELRRAGVDFHDLTMVFQNVSEPLYNDSCCHLSRAGYVRIADVIGDTLRTDANGAPDGGVVSATP